MRGILLCDAAPRPRGVPARPESDMRVRPSLSGVVNDDRKPRACGGARCGGSRAGVVSVRDISRGRMVYAHPARPRCRGRRRGNKGDEAPVEHVGEK